MAAAAAAAGAVGAALQSKTVFNPLSNKDGYNDWLYQTRSQIEKLGILPAVDAAVNEPHDAADAVIDAHIAGLNAANTAKYNAAGADVKAALKGPALKLCASRNVNGLVRVLRVLKKHYGEDAGPERATLMQEFNTLKWDPKKTTLADWIGRKNEIALRLSDIFTGPQDNVNSVYNVLMSQILLSGLPSSFDVLTNGIRAEPAQHWEAIEKRLISFDISSAGGGKQEQQGTAFLTMEDAWALFTNWSEGKGGGKGAGKGKGKGHWKVKKADDKKKKIKCWRCQKWGSHKAKDCKAPQPAGGKKE